MLQSVLVTGAFGFVGRHVARAASRVGYFVNGIGHGTWTRAEWREWGLSDWHPADVDLNALVSYGGDPSLIVHCAGAGTVGFSLSHPAQDFDRTVLSTRDVLEYARLHRPEARVVLPSSAGVYGRAQQLPISVNAPLRPISPYGFHKRMAEDLCFEYARQFGIATAVVRLFSVYGEGLRKQLLWDACTRISRGHATFGGTGDETRDWLHVEDAARLLLAAGKAASPACPVANGATGIGTSIRRIIEQIALAFGSVNNVEFSGVSRPGDPPHFVADPREAHAFGWHPEMSLDAELSRYVSWFKAGAP